jgi:hypothetical protein
MGSVKCMPHFVARQPLGKHVPTAKNTRNNGRIVGRECLCIPLSLLSNHSVKTLPRQRSIVGGVVFYAVRVVSKETRLFLPSCYCVLITQPSEIKFIKIKLPWWQSHYNYIFKIILNLKSKFRGPLSQATASKHSNAFTFTLVLWEGRAGEAWEPSYKMMLFPLPTIKCLSLLPGRFTFINSSPITSC